MRYLATIDAREIIPGMWLAVAGMGDLLERGRVTAVTPLDAGWIELSGVMEGYGDMTTKLVSNDAVLYREVSL